ncbi:winged helix-turn-helix domain-containing protein [Rhizobium sp. BK251]|uniref:ATP-binding protein n=1 Tax=Rhizobium sp. BK251 TaxID=2512125 RepID=UPI00104FA777|nr:winged helix-turn-helix domain-containing protein [Rhizobium sp. BK251]TCL67173.1 putative ATPase [Rhizobium sp. BK251]
MTSAELNDVIEFGPFRLRTQNRTLYCGAEEVQLGGRATDVLCTLARSKGELVTKEQLFNAAWPGIFVHEANLKVTVASLRRALREYSPLHEYIRTVVGRGYWLCQPSAEAVRGDADIRVVTHAQLPELGTVIGRDVEISELRETVAVNRLTTVVGAGGIGKTTVAVAAAQLFDDEEGGSIAFVDLSRVAGEEFVASSLAAALGINSGANDRLHAIASILAKRKTLLLLDTCEHVLNAVAHVCDIVLANTEDVRILATSRATLRSRREKVIRLSPLRVPPPEHTYTVEQVLQYSAPQLLVERAREKGGYLMEDMDAPAITEICRRLDGSPLALELISSRLPGRSAAIVLAELEDRFNTVIGERHKRPIRQRTLLATLEWSYALLTREEAAVLRAISIFVAYFDTDSIVRVVAHLSRDPIDIFDAVAGLRAKSMLVVEQISGELRYRLLDSTRAFAADLLERSGELPKVSENHARLMLEIFSRANIERATLPSRKWHTTYLGHADDLRKATDWALHRHGDPLLGVQLAAAGLPLWHELSLSEEARENCERALAEFARIGCKDAGLKLKLVVGLADVSSYLSADPGKAIKVFETAIELARETGDTAAECRALGALARYQLLPGRGMVALESLADMKRVAIRSNNTSALWEHEHLLVEWEIIRCEYPAAIARLEKLRAELQVHSEGGGSRFDLDPRIRTEAILGALYWLGTGKPGTGLAHIKDVAHEALEVRHGWTLIYCYTHGVLFVLLECQDYAKARYYADQLKSTIYRHGMPAWIPVANCYSEAIDTLSGARQSPDALLAAFDGLRSGLPQIGRHIYYAHLIKALLAIGCVEQALRILEHLFNVGPQRSVLPELLRFRAATERARGRDSDAIATLRESLRLAEQNGARAWTLRSSYDLATVLKDHGQMEQAREVLAPVYNQFTNGFDTGDLMNASALLAEIG